MLSEGIFSERFNLVEGEGRIISAKEIQIPYGSPLILDIDLDAFCCDKSIFGVPYDYMGIKCYEERIEKSVDLFKQLPKPNLITIATSQGEEGDKYSCFVPPFLVGDVYDCLMDKLYNIY